MKWIACFLPGVWLGISLPAHSQVNSYVPDSGNNRFVAPGSTPEAKSWAPYDTSVRPPMGSSYPNQSINILIPDNFSGASPAPILNPPVPYQFAPVYPTAPFLLR